MATRDQEEMSFFDERVLTFPETSLPGFPDGKSIQRALPGTLAECVEFGKINFLPWIDFTLEHPDEIWETEGGPEGRLYYYLNFVEKEGHPPAFAVEVISYEDVAHVNDFSLIFTQEQMRRVRSLDLVFCSAVEWQREQLVRSLNEKALLKYEENRLEEARELIDTAIRHGGSNSAYLYNNRGLISWKMGNTDQAKEDFLESIDMEQGNGDPYFNIGLIYFDESDYDRALHYLQRAVETNPFDGQFLTELGHLYLELEREDEALRLFTQALDNDPGDPQVDFHLGYYFLYKKGKPRHAVKYYHQGLKKDPEDQFAWADLAVAHWVLGHKRKTLSIQRALQTGQRLMPYTISRLVYLSVEMEDYENALKYYHQALSQSEPFEPEWLHYNAALVYAKTGRPKQALDILDLAVKAGGEPVIKRALSDKALRELKGLPDFKRLVRLTTRRRNR
ncbi:MAG: tetratricopeptide repeat protein [Desulfomonile tiedjei]|nr:tetratricopeptide repeat protein [Desulfomonile tiedjei]